jgi:tetratricopeptide (TPR) repeat protein
MMWWRSAAALLIAATAACTLLQRVVLPYRCNNIEGRVERSLEQLWPERGSFAVRQPAERNVAELAKCLDICKSDVNLRMLTASNLTLLGRSAAAAALLTEALEYDRRPELHFALAEAQVDLGQREAALENFVQAGSFSGFPILDEIPDGELRKKAYERVGSRHERALANTGSPELRNLIANGTFTEAGTSPRTGSSKAGRSPSAARSWQLLNSGAGTVSSALESAPQGRGGRAVHVTTTTPGSGLRQIIARSNSVPRSITTAWVYVTRGTVYLATGNGSSPAATTFSRTVGRWERLEAVNESCPGRTTVIYAASPGGADFYVADVTMRQTFTALPCSG